MVQIMSSMGAGDYGDNVAQTRAEVLSEFL